MFRIKPSFDEYRLKHGPLASSASDGNNGFLKIPHYRIKNYSLYCQITDGEGWEHVSVSVGEKGKKQSRCPTWEEMCWVKNQFWDDTDCVIQFHPAKEEYVNMHPWVLHLWRPTNQAIRIPDKLMVGINLK